MTTIERELLRRLFIEAGNRGYHCVRFACTPATGEDGDEIANPTLDQCFEHARAWDSDSVVEFERKAATYALPEGPPEVVTFDCFWVLLIWGNGEDLISDYSGGSEAAEAICCAVYSWREE